jgi:hypothetical protein
VQQPSVSGPRTSTPKDALRDTRRGAATRHTVSRDHQTNGTDWAIRRRFLPKTAGFSLLTAGMRYALAMPMRKPTRGRKLLIASVGVATINYVAACGGETHTSGNLIAPPGGSANGAQAGAAQAGTGGFTSGTHAGTGGTFTSGNLVPPPVAGASGKAGAGGAPGAGAGGVSSGGNAGQAGNGVSGHGGRGGSAHGGGGFTSGNLVPPPPPTAGAGGKTGASGNGGASGAAGKGGAGGTSGSGNGGVAGQ